MKSALSIRRPPLEHSANRNHYNFHPKAALSPETDPSSPQTLRLDSNSEELPHRSEALEEEDEVFETSNFRALATDMMLLSSGGYSNASRASQ